MRISDFVQKLWNLCNVLRDDGITFHQYVNELSYLLFLKLANEIGVEHEIPEGFRWRDLTSLEGSEQFDFYRLQLASLGTSNSELIRTIFANPTSLIRHPERLNALVVEINKLAWSDASR